MLWPIAMEGRDLVTEQVVIAADCSVCLFVSRKIPTSFPVSFSILTGCNLNEESVLKILKTQLRYEISNGLRLQ